MISLLDEYYAEIIAASFALSSIYQNEQMYSEAEAVLISAIDVMRKRPEEPQKHLVSAYIDLGFIYLEQERCEEAEPLLQLSLEMLIQFNGKCSALLVPVWVGLGAACTLSNRLVKREHMLLKAIEIVKEQPDMLYLLDQVEGLLEDNREMQLNDRERQSR